MKDIITTSLEEVSSFCKCYPAPPIPIFWEIVIITVIGTFFSEYVVHIVMFLAGVIFILETMKTFGLLSKLIPVKIQDKNHNNVLKSTSVILLAKKYKKALDRYMNIVMENNI